MDSATIVVEQTINWSDKLNIDENGSISAKTTEMPEILDIPEQIGGITVTSIANNWFRDTIGIKTIILLSNITLIGSYSFYEQSSIKKSRF